MKKKNIERPTNSPNILYIYTYCVYTVYTKRCDIIVASAMLEIIQVHYWSWRAVYNVFSEMQFERGRQSVKARVNACCLGFLFQSSVFFNHCHYYYYYYYYYLFLFGVFHFLPFCVFDVCNFLWCAHLVFGLYGLCRFIYIFFFITIVFVAVVVARLFPFFVVVCHVCLSIYSMEQIPRKHCAYWRWHCSSAPMFTVYCSRLCVLAIKQIETKTSAQ